MNLIISPKVRDKISEKDPPVTEIEIIECFANRSGVSLVDKREEHETNPPTQWFVAETNFGRKVKIMYIPTDEGIVIKSAYQAEDNIIRIYNKYGVRTPQ